MKIISTLGATVFISALLGQGNIALADTAKIDLPTKIAIEDLGKQIEPTILNRTALDLIQLRDKQQNAMSNDSKERLEALIDAISRLENADGANELAKVFAWIASAAGTVLASALATATTDNASILALFVYHLHEKQHSTFVQPIKVGSNATPVSINIIDGPTIVSNGLTNNVTLHQHFNYGGYGVNLSLGSYNLSSLISKGMLNDDISSLTVPTGYKVTVYEHNNFAGRATEYTRNTSWFDERHNDQLSSVKVERIIRPGIYQVRNKMSDKCLSVENASVSDRANVQQWGCTDVAGSHWMFQPLSDGAYQIQSVHSGKCMDVNNRSQHDGENILQYGCSGHDNQRFIASLNSDGSFTLKAKHSNKVLDIEGYANYNGGNLHQYTTTLADNQRFYLDNASINQDVDNTMSLIQAFQIYHMLRASLIDDSLSLTIEDMESANRVLDIYKELLELGS